ncbi:MAG: DUF4038 domain-containing protein, partial [Candidatus Omnitrophica bacterium]|nr:DUF4038 domain-containing protein [Candidatus Omnitrophota bacterium]
MKKIIYFLFIFILFHIGMPTFAAGADLTVSNDGHWLVNRDSGEPFFLMADSAWRLHSLSSSEQDIYFRNRQNKRFTACYVGLTTYWSSDPDGYGANANGDMPFNDSSDCLDWNYDYFEHISSLIARAASYDMYIILEVGEPCDSRRDCFVGSGNTSEARQWGEQVGDYFKDHENVIFALGQDRD